MPVNIMTLIPLSAEVERASRSLHHRDPALTESDITHLREWIGKQPHLPQNHDDTWLQSFLCGCKYSLEKCKRKLDTYYTVRTELPQFFANRDPASEEIRSSLTEHIQFTLPKLHPDGYILGFGKLLENDPDNFDFIKVMRRVSISADCLLHEAKSHGVVFVVDCKDVTFQHFIQIAPHLKNVVYVLQEAYPFKFVGLHYINTPSYIDSVRKMIWPMLPEKITKRIHFYTDNNIEELYQFVPQDMLPNDYGGKAGTAEELNLEYQNRLEACRKWFLEEAAKTVDETLRPSDNINNLNENSKLFGSQGSFRKINLD